MLNQKHYYLPERRQSFLEDSTSDKSADLLRHYCGKRTGLLKQYATAVVVNINTVNG